MILYMECADLMPRHGWGGSHESDSIDFKGFILNESDDLYEETLLEVT